MSLALRGVANVRGFVNDYVIILTRVNDIVKR